MLFRAPIYIDIANCNIAAAKWNIRKCCFTFCAIEIILSPAVEAGRGAAAGGVTANRLVVGSIPTRGDEIFT